MRTLPCFGIIVALITVASPASACGSGSNLSWNECGAGGFANLVSACDTNAGSQTMVVSYVPPSGVDSLVASLAIIDLCSMTSTLPAWWELMNSGSCRNGALSVSTDFSSPAYTYCRDYWGGHASVQAQYILGYGGDPNAARILMSASMPAQFAAPLDAANEYYDFLVRITNIKTVGSDSCAGCDVGVCIVLNEVQLHQSGGAASYVFIDPVNRYSVNWQRFIPGCPFIVPVKNRSWGSIKALYR